MLDEAFVDMPQFSLHPQTLVMENLWVAKWIERCLQKQKEVRQRDGTDQTIFFADRSPYSAIFYGGPDGKLLEPLIQAQLKQLHQLAGITIITVYVKVDEAILWERIQERLKREPYREKFNESSQKWMQQTVDFYENNAQLWNFTAENDSSIRTLIDKVVKQLSDEEPRFGRLAHSISPEIAPPSSPGGIEAIECE